MRQIAYQYNNKGYYVGETGYSKNQLPANATLIMPSLEEGYIPKFNGTTWEQVENHVGEKGYVNNEPFEIKEYGAYPEGWTTEIIYTLEETKTRKLEELNSKVTSLINTGFWYEDKNIYNTALHYSYDATDQLNFQSAMNGVNARALQVASSGSSSLPDVVTWNAYTDIEHLNLVQVVFNSESFGALWYYSEIIHKNSILEKARVLKDQVKNANTKEEVETIIWED